MMNLHQLSAVEAAQAIRDGRITSEKLVSACLDHIDAIEDQIGAWTYLDRTHALKQARQADAALQTGNAHGALHGVPVGVKDIFDTFDMPTEDGTVLHAGTQPDRDATAVGLLRAAGAVIMGKTVTTELAVYAPGKTRNPHNPEHTPGGSSSGSAAAVAAGMVPLALGTQTNGSMIRPASYCGVFGFKPTFGRISRHRVLHHSRPLDQIGVFARSLDDIALATQLLMQYDDRDPDMRLQSQPPLMATLSEDPPTPPRLAFVKSPVWGHAVADTRSAFLELADFLGEDAEDVPLPEIFDSVIDWHRTVMDADLARSFAREYDRGKNRLSAILVDMVERGQQIPAVAYNDAVAQQPVLNRSLETIFEWHDAIITPATTGEAPFGLESTGSPIFCTLWTFCGMPSISLPLLQGSGGLPIGVQLVGPRHDDARLLRTARWLVERVAE